MRQVLFILLLSTFAVAAWAADQPQWGERLSRNMVSEEKGLPDDFDPKTARNVKWTAALGTQTYSTPIVAAGRVFIGTNNDEPRDDKEKGDRSVLMCFDEKDGTFLWQFALKKLASDIYLDWPRVGLVSPVTVQRDRLYFVSNRAEVRCLDLDGKPVWTFDMVTGAGIHPHDSSHGTVLIDGPLVYVNTSNGVDGSHRKILAPDAPSLIVLEKATGRLVAKDNERMAPRTIHCTWSSPSRGNVGGQPLAFFGGGDGVCYAFEALASVPPPGQVLPLKKVWQFDCDPAAPKEDIFRYQDNRREGPSNITGMPVFHENRIYVEAGGDVWHGRPKAWLKCIDATKTGDVTASAEVWSYPLSSHCMSTPAIHAGLAYIVDAGRQIHCIDAQTGKPCWTHRAKGEIWSSPLVGDGKVYIGTRRGDFWILAAGREKNVLASIDFDSPIHATATAANGVLYVATMNRLYALKKP
jgi:outer membrane protein assembly factor BamB